MHYTFLNYNRNIQYKNVLPYLIFLYLKNHILYVNSNRTKRYRVLLSVILNRILRHKESDFTTVMKFGFLREVPEVL